LKEAAVANQVTPNFENIDTPGAIVRLLEGHTMAELVALFHRAETATARGWMLMSCIVGVALGKAKYGQGAARKLATEFGCSERTIHRLAEVFSQLINPRLEVEGERAKFPLEQQRFYSLAIEGAHVAHKKPLELLAEAEAAKAKDPKFTARAFKKRIYGDREARRSSRLLPAVKQLANARAEAVRQLVTVADATELTAILDAAVAKLSDARRFLQREAA
jgi:hypothetical protein